MFSDDGESLVDFCKRLKEFEEDTAVFLGPKLIAVIVDGFVRSLGEE